MERKRSMKVSTSRCSRALRGQRERRGHAGPCLFHREDAAAVVAGRLNCQPAGGNSARWTAATPSGAPSEGLPALGPLGTPLHPPHLRSVGTSTMRLSRSIRNTSCAVPSSACCGRSTNCALNSLLAGCGERSGGAAAWWSPAACSKAGRQHGRSALLCPAARSGGSPPARALSHPCGRCAAPTWLPGRWPSPRGSQTGCRRPRGTA